MSNPRDFIVEREYEFVPEEDYNEDEDYSFGMAQMLKITGFGVMAVIVLGLVSLLFFGYFS